MWVYMDVLRCMYVTLTVSINSSCVKTCSKNLKRNGAVYEKVTANISCVCVCERV